MSLFNMFKSEKVPVVQLDDNNKFIIKCPNCDRRMGRYSAAKIEHEKPFIMKCSDCKHEQHMIIKEQYGYGFIARPVTALFYTLDDNGKQTCIGARRGENYSL